LNNILRNSVTAKASLILFFIIPIFVYVLFATNFTFDFFQPYFLWKGYNYYFLAIINGQLDVPAHAIGREASYIGNKVYMYYGALPLISRVLLYPFVNLEQTSIAAFSVFMFSIVGQSYLQYSLLQKFRQYLTLQTPCYVIVGFIFLSLALWFGSATFVIIQNSTIYHEPYAASLCLVNIFLGVLIKHDFLLKNSRHISLMPYAVLAALCIHARMPTALALYCVVVFLIIVQTYKHFKSMSDKAGFNLIAFFSYGFKTYYSPLFVMFIGGVSILILNYLKFDNALAFMGKNYGYFLLEGYSERRCNIVPQSEFASILRVIPNTVIYLTSSTDLHWSLTWHLKTGFGRKEMPIIPLLVLWLMPLLSFAGIIYFIVKNHKKPSFKYIGALLFLLSIGALFQLSYPTIAHRYIAELWLPLAFSMVFLWCYFSRKLLVDIDNGNKKLSFKKIKLVYFIFIVSSSIGIGYQLYLSVTNKYYLQDGPVYKHENYHYSAKDIEYLSQLTGEKIRAFKENYKAEKTAACEKLAEKINLPPMTKKEAL
jgi:hypothetical protein